ncbi:MAG: aconitate hydratase [Chitinivibrionales bacterium]
MKKTATHKLIQSHLISGTMKKGEEIGLKIDQTLTQDATGTLVMLEFEAMGIDRVKTEVSVQYVDHNLLQTDFRNADDHLFLCSACKKFGLWFSPPGNGVSHPVHAARFAAPGKTLLGSDSHTCSNGSMGMLAIGAGGLEVAMAMAGKPFYVKMPSIAGIKLTGALKGGVSAKDVILEMLRRKGVAGGVGKVFEYYGPGLENLTAMDRHVIANMGAELGATTSVFPSDEQTRRFLASQGRQNQWSALAADEDAEYDEYDEIDLGTLEPLIALPSSPGNVVPVREVAGKKIHQAYIGSSANPGIRDFAVPAMMLDGKRVAEHVSLDINPSSRQVLEYLTHEGYLEHLILAGGRIHQPGCNGCIGMGQAPASGKISLRTVPRNFPGRSGTKGDQVYLCSPETAVASAIKGEITVPGEQDMPSIPFVEPERIDQRGVIVLQPAPDSKNVELEKGPNIQGPPRLGPIPETLDAPALIKLGDDISTDEILPAGAEILPYRSNIPAISEFVFSRVDEDYVKRVSAHKRADSIIIGGANYGQGSSREHAALCPRYLGVRAVIARSFARIHWQNLVNFGILPLTFCNAVDYDAVSSMDRLKLTGLYSAIENGASISVENSTTGKTFLVEHALTQRQKEVMLAGGLINMAAR